MKKYIYFLKRGMDFKSEIPRPLLPPLLVLERTRTQLIGPEESTSHGTQ